MTIKEKTTLATRLAATEPKLRAIYVSTYIPRECGIATFTKDLTNAINLLNPHSLADIVAIDDEKSGGVAHNYPWEVKYKINQEELRSWIDAADYINQSGADIVCLEHEFGIYGGFEGEYAVPFVEALKKPVTVTFHTVLPEPNAKQREMVRRLCKRADAVIVMVNTGAERLIEAYDVDPNKIVVIHHGVPDIAFGPTEGAKKNIGLSGFNIISGFGLLGPGKGYEHAISAMPAILAKNPKTKLLLLGQTHPVSLRYYKTDKYRQKLVRLIKKLDIEKDVMFVNRYLSLDEIIGYLRATDVYITPFPNLDQITSGTLSYAIGAGKACVSTPYLYAKEVLADNRGLLVQPEDSADLAEKITYLLDHPRKRLEIAKNAYSYGRNMIWPSVALRHLDLFEIIAKHNDQA